MSGEKSATGGRRSFWIVYFLGTAAGGLSMFCVCDWTILHHHKVSDESNVMLEVVQTDSAFAGFDFHPVLMNLGMVILLGQGAVGVRKSSKSKRKIEWPIS